MEDHRRLGWVGVASPTSYVARGGLIGIKNGREERNRGERKEKKEEKEKRGRGKRRKKKERKKCLGVRVFKTRIYTLLEF